MDNSKKVGNSLSIGWAIGLLLNGLVWLLIGLRSGDPTHLIMSAGLLLAAFAAFKIKVLSATRAAHFLFYGGSALMLVSALVALRQ